MVRGREEGEVRVRRREYGKGRGGREIGDEGEGCVGIGETKVGERRWGERVQCAENMQATSSEHKQKKYD